MDSNDRTRVADVMSSPPETVGADASLREAARRMRDADVSALVVTIGGCVITRSDIVDAVADGLDPAEAVVRDAMRENVETVTPDLLMEEVAAMMTMYDVEHLPVVDGDHVGMVSATDVAEHRS